MTLAGMLSSAAVAIENDHPAIAQMLKDAAMDAQKMEIFCNERVAEAQEESMIARDFKRQERLRECGVIPFPRRERQSRGWDAVGAEVVELHKNV